MWILWTITESWTVCGSLLNGVVVPGITRNCEVRSSFTFCGLWQIAQ